MNQKGMLQASQVVCLLLAFSKCTLASNSWLTPDHTQLVTAQSSLLHQVGLCSDSRCSCGYSLHGTINITCQCSPQDQEATLDVRPSSVHRDVSHVAIQSCRSVVFHKGGLRHLNHLSIVSVVDVGEIVFHSGSFNQLNVERETFININRCRQLTIETGAFTSHPLRPVSVSSTHCYSVIVEEQAFSRLTQLNLTYVQSLHLASQAFRFATGSLTDMDHIRTKIRIEHVTMTDLKSFTFPSPLDRLHFENVTVSGQIESNATSALRIVHLIIRSSKIGSIAAGAFSEFTHLDTLEMRSTWVDQIASKAFASAASSFVFEGCNIGRMNQSALYMPVARVTLRDNQIEVLATGALHLREWNELLVEYNTVGLVERNAFYNIGEPQILPLSAQVSTVRFVIRGNIFHRTQLGAFIISAQVPQLKLEQNYFKQDCDCHMASWTGRLTQINRQTETTSSSTSEDPLTNALWLGSSLFNSSLCWLDRAAAECLEFSEPKFLSMTNYTEEFCSTLRESEINHCLTIKRSQHDVYGIVIDFQADSESGTKLVSQSSRQDLVMIIILGVLCGFVLLAICFGLVFTHFRSHGQRQHPNHKIVSAEERVTCSPLISDNEKPLGSGVVSSGSISRLSVKEYRNYLEELGPIYSEPVEVLDRSPIPSKQSTPPALPAMPVQWTPKGTQKIDDGNKRTIDRGTQTLEESSKSVIQDDSASSVQFNEPTSSLALEFTEDVFAALRDKMDVSPMYSEVKDSIVTGEVDQSVAQEVKLKDLYDLIKVVDIVQKPSSASPPDPNPIYCKPWNSDPLSSQLLSPGEKQLDQSKSKENDSTQHTSSSKINSLPPSKVMKENVKSQPFHVRGSLPKWPPPMKSSNSKTSKSRPTTTQPPVTKESKPLVSPLQNRARTVAKTTTATRSDSHKSQPPTNVEKSHVKPQSRKKQSTNRKSSDILGSPDVVNETPSLSPSLTPSLSPSLSASSENKMNVDEYAQVVDQPFSFSFRRPLFSDRSETTAAESAAPPKPTRKEWLCEYSDPRDLNEPLYSELIVEEEKQPYHL